MNNTFDFNRFSLLLKKELWSGNKKPLIVAGASFGFLMLYALFMIYNDGPAYRWLNWNVFPIVLFGGGFIFTSTIFYEFNNKTGTHHYLSLPASTFEKFLSKWLITTIIFPIIVIILFSIYVAICDSSYIELMMNTHDATELRVNNYYTPWKLTDWWSIFFLKLYFVLQSIYLAGAIAFQKYTFFKTSLSLWLFGVASAMIFVVLLRVIFNEFFESLFQPRTDVYWNTSDEVHHFMENTFQPMLINACWLLVAPTIWTVGFFKLKEKEA
jgi:hypothetical protein